MGLRLRGQLMILCFGLMGISLSIIAYFNIGVFRLSFLADEEQRLRATGQRTGERIMGEVLADALGRSTKTGLTFRSSSVKDFDFRSVPGLRYFELWDTRGSVMMRAGITTQDIPQKTLLLRSLLLEPLPTHLFLDSATEAVGPMALPYRDSLSSLSENSKGHITYEFFFPIFLTPDMNGANLDMLPPAELTGILHLSFEVDNTSKRVRVVTMGNALLGLTFLLTTLMAMHLWSQHAIQRPLEGLVESMRQLEPGPSGQELESHNELANISKTMQHLALDRLKYQRELENLNRSLERQVEEKTLEMKEFFSLVTHDLRIPLAAVQGYCDLLKRKPEELSERQLTFIKRIATANGHSLELVRNLLEAMKIEFGDLEPVTEVFDVKTLAEEVRDELNIDDSLPPVNLEPSDEASEEALVEADRTRIKRVFTNLLSNAQKHATGTPQVTLRWKKVPRKGVRFQVEDLGPGIPPEECKRVFEKFTRAPDSMGNSTGLGLGLFIVGKILQSHGEEISLKSEVGKGTTFEFCLPSAADEASC